LYTATEPGLTGVHGAGLHRNLGGKGQCPAVAAVLAELMPVLG
jgi:heptosyltransferase-1